MAERPKVVPPKQSVSPANALEILGGMVLAVGLGLIHVWIGLVAFGVVLVLTGITMEVS